MKVVLSWGLGVDSTAILVRWLLDPTSRDFALRDLIVLTAQVGDEFPDSGRLVREHLLPMLRAAGVRFVQVGRTGPSTRDWAVLDDSRCPSELHLEGGGYRLSEELLGNGTVPQVGSCRKCSLKYKGTPLDAWLAQEFGSGSFRHVMGFNADELRRVERDRSYSREERHSEYPLVTWGWGREACELYLALMLGESWRKSCCWHCPFANNKAGIGAHMRRLDLHPELAAEAAVIERCSEALNPRQPLYVGKHDYQALLDAHGCHEALSALRLRLEATTWAIYRVRRLYSGKATAQRSVRQLATGTRPEMVAMLGRVGASLGLDVTDQARTQVVWRERKAESFPCREELLVVAPALVNDKEPKTFETKWAQLSTARAA